MDATGINLNILLTKLLFFFKESNDSKSKWWVYFLTIFEFCLAFIIMGTVKFI